MVNNAFELKYVYEWDTKILMEKPLSVDLKIY